MARPGDDPGWRLHPGMFMPGLGAIVMQRRRGDEDGLAALRALFVAFVTPTLWFGLILFLVMPAAAQRGTALGLAGALVALGLVLRFVGAHVAPLRCAEVQGSYRRRLFVRLALAEVTVLAGFASALLAGHRWLYVVGVVASLPAYLLAAPTRGNLATDQAALRAEGCDADLVAGLRSSLTSPHGQ